MVLLPICSLPHMHSNVLFLSANCVEVRHSRSWNEATSRRRTSQMLRLIPLRPRKVWNRRWYHVGISTMWFCTCTEYRAQYQYMSYYMVRFIYIYIVIVYTVGMGLQHESEFHSPQGASFHQGGSLLHIPKLSLCSLVCMQTFFEAPSNLFFSFRWVFFTYVFMGCESMWCFFWFFGIVTFKQIWLLLTLLPASTRETASRTMDEWEKSGAALSWQSHVLGACYWSSLKIPCKLLAMKRWSCFIHGDFFWNLPLGFLWSFTMIQKNIDEMRFRKHR